MKLQRREEYLEALGWDHRDMGAGEANQPSEAKAKEYMKELPQEYCWVPQVLPENHPIVSAIRAVKRPKECPPTLLLFIVFII